jgi:hypothetical protein
MGGIAALLLTAMTIFSLPEVGGDRSPRKDYEDVKLILTADKTTAKLGEPILVSISMKYDGPEPSTYDDQAIGANDCFVVTGPDGKSVPYIGERLQTVGGGKKISPGESVCLTKGLDLSWKYLFNKPGQYTVKCGRCFGVARVRFLESDDLKFSIEQGEMLSIDKLVERLLSICPKGWYISKTGQRSGWGKPGVCWVLIQQSVAISNEDKSTVAVCQTEEPVEPKGMSWYEYREKKRLVRHYLGKGPFGHLYVSLNLKSAGSPNWADPVADLMRGLITGN